MTARHSMTAEYDDGEGKGVFLHLPHSGPDLSAELGLTTAPFTANCYPRAPKYLAPARMFTKGTLQEWGLATLAHIAASVVTELLAHAIARTPPADSDNGSSVWLSLAHRPAAVLCTVFASTPAFEPSPAKPLTDDTKRGMLIVEALSEEWGWRLDGGTTIWARIPTRRRSTTARRPRPQQRRVVRAAGLRPGGPRPDSP